MATVRRQVRFRDHDQFLRFVQLYNQRIGVNAAINQLCGLQLSLDGQARLLASYEGVPLDRPMVFDAQGALIAWEEEESAEAPKPSDAER